jgi:hypothetical protein
MSKLREHGIIEHDLSLTRGDKAKGNNWQLNKEKLNVIADYAKVNQSLIIRQTRIMANSS